MKLINFFSILAPLLLISLPLFDAQIICPYGNINNPSDNNNCSTSCAVYKCNGTTGNSAFTIQVFGCPDDFFRDCFEFSEEIEYVNGTDYNQLEYSTPQVTYVSGCAGKVADENQKCLLNKLKGFEKIVAKRRKTDPRFKHGEAISVKGDSSTLVSEAPDVFSSVTSDASSNVTSDSPALETVPPIIVPDAPILSSLPPVLNPDIPVLPTVPPFVVIPGNQDSGDNSSEPSIIIPVMKSTPFPSDIPVVSASSDDSMPVITTTKRTRTSTTTSTSKPKTKTTTLAASTTDNPDLKNDVTIATPAKQDPETTTSASKQQEGNFWKKIGCFIIGTILAAWIY